MRDNFERIEGDEDDFDRAHDGGSSGKFNGACSFLPGEGDEAFVVGGVDVIKKKGLQAIGSSTLTHLVGCPKLEAGVEGTELVHGAGVQLFPKNDAAYFSIFVREG